MEPTLKICAKCQLHAVIIGATDDATSPVVDSKPFARAMIDDGIKLGFLKPEDRQGLEKQVAGSSLPEKAEDVRPEVKSAVINWNFAVAENPSDPLRLQIECIVEFIQGARIDLKRTLSAIEKFQNAQNN